MPGRAVKSGSTPSSPCHILRTAWLLYLTLLGLGPWGKVIGMQHFVNSLVTVANWLLPSGSSQCLKLALPCTFLWVYWLLPCWIALTAFPLVGAWWDFTAQGPQGSASKLSLSPLWCPHLPSSGSSPFDIAAWWPASHLTLTSKNCHILVPKLERLVWLSVPLEPAETARSGEGDGKGPHQVALWVLPPCLLGLLFLFWACCSYLPGDSVNSPISFHWILFLL